MRVKVQYWNLHQPQFSMPVSIVFLLIRAPSLIVAPPSRKPFNPFPNERFLDSSKLKEFEDDNFKFDKYGLKFYKRVENIVGKGEIARYEQFLRFPQCFQKT